MFKKKSILLVTLSFLTMSSVVVAESNSRSKPTVKNEIKNNSDVVAQSTRSVTQTIAEYDKSYKEIVDEVWQIVNTQFVDPSFNGVDWQAVRKDYLSRTYEDSATAYQDIKEMLSLLGDPYTKFITPKEYEVQYSTDSNVAGIGLQIIQDETTQEIIVNSAYQDTPAYNAGIFYGDIINQINGRDTKEMGVNDVVTLLRGEPGTKVNLIVTRDDEEIEFNIVRAKVEIDPVRSQIKEVNGRKISYIRLELFSAQAAKEIEQALRNFEEQQVAGYILDLRSNSGGLLYSAINIARMWLEEGLIVHTISRQGKKESESAKNKALTDKPLVVLVNEGSASATEILAGALQENDRATIVGKQTYGQGLIQSVRPLSDGSGIAVTTAKFLTPKENEIQDRGIQPDIEVEYTESELAKLSRDPNLLATEEDLMWNEAVEVLQQQL